MAEHAADAQAAAFRGASPADLCTDGDLQEMYDAGLLLDSTCGPIVPVEEHEAARWDAGRQGPKDLQEARDALAARVADPTAPDNDATAYDAL